MLYIDLQKAKTLDTTKLVKKPVLVRGKDGKVHTRMQWVKPGEIPTADKPKGAEKKEEKPIKTGPLGGVPAPKKQDKEYKNISHIIESSKETAEKEAKMEAQLVIDVDPISSGSSVTTGTFKEKNKESYTFKGLRNMFYGTVGEGSIRSNLRKVSELVTGPKWEDVKDELKSQIESSTPDLEVRRLKLQALIHGNMKHDLSVACHPLLAREAVNDILGDELAERFRKDIANASLSINFAERALDKIKENGYVASTPEKFLEAHGSVGM